MTQLQTSTPGLAALLTGFAQFARERGLAVGIAETLTALRTFDLGVLEDKAVLYYTLKTLFCSDKDDFPLFDQLFKIYWEAEEDDVKRVSRHIKDPHHLPKQKNVLAVWGQGKQEGEQKEDSRTVSGANAVERLRRTDFSKVAEMDTAILEELAEKLWREMSKRLRRRLRARSQRQRIDLRRTIRASLQHGGDPVELRYRGNKPKKLRLVVLLDVSGSMDKYSFFLLRFVLALQKHFESVESFVFSTHLRRITDFLEKKGLEQTLHELGRHTDNWSSGTKIGLCLREFNEHYARQTLCRSNLVIVLSDGLDTGEGGMIETELAKIRRRSRRLVWLNPLKGMEGYQPTARGMAEALPQIDTFRSAHNLESLLELENLLVHV